MTADKNIRFRILEVHTKGKPIGRDIDLMKIAEKTNGFSGAEVSAVVNTAISLVLHEYLQKYPSPDAFSLTGFHLLLQTMTLNLSFVCICHKMRFLTEHGYQPQYNVQDEKYQLVKNFAHSTSEQFQFF